MMHKCLILLGSNSDAEKSLPEARKCLEQTLCFQQYTEVMQSEPFGGKGPSPYHNQLVRARTSLTFDQLVNTLKDIESRLGRVRYQDCAQRFSHSGGDCAQRFSRWDDAHIVRIDLDILEYDGEKHHLRDWERPYVQQLLPKLNHDFNESHELSPQL